MHSMSGMAVAVAEDWGVGGSGEGGGSEPREEAEDEQSDDAQDCLHDDDATKMP